MVVVGRERIKEGGGGRTKEGGGVRIEGVGRSGIFILIKCLILLRVRRSMHYALPSLPPR
jgi:hypothetical protein